MVRLYARAYALCARTCTRTLVNHAYFPASDKYRFLPHCVLAEPSTITANSLDGQPTECASQSCCGWSADCCSPCWLHCVQVLYLYMIINKPRAAVRYCSRSIYLSHC